MSSALSLLKSAGSNMKPYNGFAKLPEGAHKIYNFKLVPNKLYNAKDKKSLKKVIMIELKEEVLFLPEYFCAAIKQDESKIDELNNDGIAKYLYFGGRRGNK